jgi:hypothetical protein
VAPASYTESAAVHTLQCNTFATTSRLHSHAELRQSIAFDQRCMVAFCERHMTGEPRSPTRPDDGRAGRMT